MVGSSALVILQGLEPAYREQLTEGGVMLKYIRAGVW